MAEEQKNIQRKHELGETIAKCATEERKVSPRFSPNCMISGSNFHSEVSHPSFKTNWLP